MFYNNKFIVNDVFELLFNVDSDKSVDDKFMIMKKDNNIKLLQIKNKIPDGYQDFYQVRTGITIEPFKFKCRLNMALFKSHKYIEKVEDRFMRCYCCYEIITTKKFGYCYTNRKSNKSRRIKNYICLGCHEIFPVFIFEILKEKIMLLDIIIDNDDIVNYILSYMKYFDVNYS